ncbi:hypothetical protein RRG08_016583 [Elysia crispata]|uniref:C-type lectin domain-containing protein n=1 Tax=Elysia crispata TaxID=231223 RepID=A0AAE0Y9V1_9GAST|nr:hypothetical protein RRG08_016583 [Elysia crispata]
MTKLQQINSFLSIVCIIYLLPFKYKCIADMSCPRQWKFLSIQMRTCVKPFFLLKSWHGARKLCQDAGGDIVGISDFDKFNHVYDKLTKLQGNTFWIGVKYFQSAYREITGSKKVHPSNLFLRKPDIPTKTGCVAIGWTLYYKMEVLQCNQANSFLCEISPVCANNTYGTNCNEKCSRYCAGANNQCDKINGSCTFGCLDGYQGVLCDKVCKSRTYGKKCSKRCSSHCYGKKKSCGHINGWCVHGCMDGYQGKRCDTVCANNAEIVVILFV